MRPSLALASLVVAVACGDDSPKPGVDAALDASGPDARAGDDASATDAGEDASPAREPTALPLTADDVAILGTPGGIEVMSVVLVDGAELHLVYERFDVAFTEGQLEERVGVDPLALSEAVTLAGEAAFHASPSAADATSLYLLEADSVDGRGTLVRRLLGASGWEIDGEVETEGLFNLLMWPRVLRLDDGRSALAYRDGSSRPRIATSDDGLSFGDADIVGPPGAMANIGQLADGTLAYTYQTQDVGMTSWVTLSPDGNTWTEPVEVTDASSNVHDTSLVRREDGDLDLYYIYATVRDPGFSLYRRMLAADGSLGEEQRVTDATVDEPSKPAATRLADSSLFVRWAAITMRDGSGLPIEQVLHGAIVWGDAPR